MFLALDVQVYSSFHRSGTTVFKCSSLHVSLLTVLLVVYSCFEKGCPTPETVRDDAKGTMGYSGSRSLIEALGVSAAKREISQTNLFMPSLFLLVNNLILNPPPNSFYP